VKLEDMPYLSTGVLDKGRLVPLLIPLSQGGKTYQRALAASLGCEFLPGLFLCRW
jgi:hypothetical protein